MPKISKIATFLKEYEAITKRHAVNAYICFCLVEEDNFEDEIDDHIAVADNFAVLGHRNMCYVVPTENGTATGKHHGVA